MNPLRNWMLANEKTQAETADDLDVSQPTVSNWAKLGGVPPKMHWTAIEMVTNGDVTKESWADYIELLEENTAVNVGPVSPAVIPF